MGKLLKTGWYVLYVRSRYERRVNELLKENGLESFLPLVTTIRKWSDRQKKIEMPLFSSYVFVNIKTSMDLHKTLAVEGACAFIRFGNEFAIVKEPEIEKIRLLVNIEGIKDLKSDSTLPNLGEMMEISYGPLEGLTCKVMRIDDNFRIQVSIDSLRQSIYATLPSLFLTPLVSA